MIDCFGRRKNKLLLVGNYLPDQQHSMQIYATFLQGGIAGCGVHVDLIRPAELLGRLSCGVQPLVKFFGYVDKFVLFPVRLWWIARGYGLVHICDQGNAPYVRP